MGKKTRGKPCRQRSSRIAFLRGQRRDHIVWELVLILPIMPTVVGDGDNRSPADYQCLRICCRIAGSGITLNNHDGEMAKRACFSSLIHLGTQELQLTMRLVSLLKHNSYFPRDLIQCICRHPTLLCIRAFLPSALCTATGSPLCSSHP